MTWRNVSMVKKDESSEIIWRLEPRTVDDLMPCEKTPRQLTEKQVEGLQKLLELFNLAEIPTVNTDNTVIAGRQRLRTLQALGRGKKRINVRVPNRKLTREEIKDYNRNGNFIQKLWKIKEVVDGKEK